MRQQELKFLLFLCEILSNKRFKLLTEVNSYTSSNSIGSSSIEFLNADYCFEPDCHIQDIGAQDVDIQPCYF